MEQQNPETPTGSECQHFPVYDDVHGAGYAFCKHCNKQWDKDMQEQFLKGKQ